MTDAIAWSRVAHLYDAYVQVTLDVPFFVAEARKAAGPVLELMAGTGRVSVPLAEAGVDLTCVDLSAEMLAILQAKLEQRGLRARIIQADACALDLPERFDLIAIPFHSFSELLLPRQYTEALARIRRHLAPGGRFICTLHNPPIRARTVDGQLRLWGRQPLPGGATLLFWGQEEYAGPERRTVRGVELFEEYDAQGIMRTRRLLDIRYRLWYRQEFEELAGQAGFSVVALYGDYSRAEFREDSSPFMIWVLQG